MSDEPKKRIGRWKEGESGNPTGRPRDERKQQLRQALLDAMPDVLNELISIVQHLFCKFAEFRPNN